MDSLLRCREPRERIEAKGGYLWPLLFFGVPPIVKGEQAMTVDEDQENKRRGNLLTAPLRFLLHWIIKAIVFMFLGIRLVLRPRAVRYGLVALIVVLAIGWKVIGVPIQGMQTFGPQTATTGSTMSTTATNQLPPSPVVETYLQAQAAFDGKTMWDQIGQSMKNSMQANSGATLQQLQQELNSAKQQGRRYTGAIYVGGVPMSDGESVYFYVLKVETPNGSTDVPYIYIVGKDGKIASIQ